MTLTQLQLYNYKNISEAHLELSPNVNCFVGGNGQGKTNVLDAIYYLSFCKSNLTPLDRQVIRHDADFMSLAGRYEFENGESERIVCSVRRTGGKKVFKHNDKAYTRLADHIGKILLVIVSPADQELILGGSDQRRRFMDLVISQYDADYLNALIRYRKALQQRNALLKGDQPMPSPAFFEIYETEMARTGTLIYEKRRTFVDGFVPIFQDIYNTLADASGEKVSIEYTSHGHRGDLLTQFREHREREAIVGFSLCGVHRDELDLQLSGYPIKTEGSQGQNKTFLIAMKLAQFDYLRTKGAHRTPLLLLDDIFDKLDASRVEQIVRMVAGNRFGQIFITDTNRDFLRSVLERTGKPFRMFGVEEGNITPLEQ